MCNAKCAKWFRVCGLSPHAHATSNPLFISMLYCLIIVFSVCMTIRRNHV